MYKKIAKMCRLVVKVSRGSPVVLLSGILLIGGSELRGQAGVAGQSESVSNVINYSLGDSEKMRPGAFALMFVRVLQPYRPAMQFVVRFTVGSVKLTGSETEECVECVIVRSAESGIEELRRAIARLKGTPPRSKTRQLDEAEAWNLMDEAAELMKKQFEHLNARREKYRKTGISDITFDGPHFQLELYMDGDTARITFDGPLVDFGPRSELLESIQSTPLAKFLRRLFALSGLQLRPGE